MNGGRSTEIKAATPMNLIKRDNRSSTSAVEPQRPRLMKTHAAQQHPSNPSKHPTTARPSESSAMECPRARASPCAALLLSSSLQSPEQSSWSTTVDLPIALALVGKRPHALICDTAGISSCARLACGRLISSATYGTRSNPISSSQRRQGSFTLLVLDMLLF